MTTRGNDLVVLAILLALWYTVVYVCNRVVVFGYNGSYFYVPVLREKRSDDD
jgi:hypothetical protein